MNARDATLARDGGACVECQRRSWLVGELSPVLDHLAGDRTRLHAALGLADEELIPALGGRRRKELSERHAAFAAHTAPAEHTTPAERAAHTAPRRAPVERVCRHDARYPRALRGAGSPHMLEAAGGVERLARLARGPVVALIGSTRASDYGRALARSLACDLAASGVVVASGLLDGIAAAAQAGALAGGGVALAVLGDGLGVPAPARRQALLGRLARSGCAVSELPRECSGRRWGQPAAVRVLIALASLVVVVEARDDARELAGAETARELGRPLAALPGRVTSPLSSGPHALLLEGASPIRSAEDVLELLHRHSPEAGPWHGSADIRLSADVPVRSGGHREPDPRAGVLAPHLRSVLDLVGAGADTPDRLLAAGADASSLLLALTELELRGLLARGENGRYLPVRASLPDRARGYQVLHGSGRLGRRGARRNRRGDQPGE